jgi:enoyl-CoA hydratase/carnithine racemase
MPSSFYEAIQVETADGVGWLTLNRPEAINAINLAMRREVPEALRALDADPAVSVIVLRGAGQRGFCSGADLKESGTAAAEKAQSAQSRESSWIQSLDDIGKPLVAVIHGYCFGGGLEVALACDIRIAASDAQFALPETGLGLIPGGGGTQRLPRVVGLGRAVSMMLTGERMDAQEALRAGLVTRLLPPGEKCFGEAVEFVQRIAQRPPMATRFAKQAARNGLELPLSDGLRLERELFVRLLGTEDRHEAAAAFRERRAPVFKNN